MEKPPLVSVVIPCYNHELYVVECIESVIHQTYQNIQLIVIDDGSTDNSPKILRNLQQKYGFILECQKNMGLSKTLNKVLEKYVQGKYFCTLASDDYWTLDKIEKQVKYMEANSDKAMVFGGVYIINNSKITRKTGIDIDESYLCFKEIFKSGKIPALTVMLRTDAILKVGGYRENSIIEDIDMWLKIAFVYPIGYINTIFGYYRQHESNVSKKIVTMFSDRVKLLEYWKEKVDSILYNQKLGQIKSEAFFSLAIKHKKEALKYIPDIRYANMHFLKGIILFIFFRNNKKKNFSTKREKYNNILNGKI